MVDICWNSLQPFAELLTLQGVRIDGKGQEVPLSNSLHPRKLTWIPKLMMWKRWLLLNMAIFGLSNFGGDWRVLAAVTYSPQQNLFFFIPQKTNACLSLGGGFKYFYIFTPTWRNVEIWRAYFFKWVGSTTNYFFSVGKKYMSDFKQAFFRKISVLIVEASLCLRLGNLSWDWDCFVILKFHLEPKMTCVLDGVGLFWGVKNFKNRGHLGSRYLL